MPNLPMKPLYTAVVDHWTAAEAHLAERASGSAYVLTELTALNDADLHHIMLDPESRTIWHAYDNSPLDEEGWTVEQLAPEDAAERFSDQIWLIVDKFEDLADNPLDNAYAEGLGTTLGEDQDAVDEYTDILRLAVPQNPLQARLHIKARRDSLARRDALWQRTYANMVRTLSGPDHGGNARAARDLNLSKVQVGRLIDADDKRRRDLEDALATATEERRHES